MKARKIELVHFFYIALTIVVAMLVLQFVQVSSEKKMWKERNELLDAALFHISDNNNYLEAEQYLESLMKDKGMQEEYYLNWLLAEAKLYIGKYDESEKFYNKAQELNPFLIKLGPYSFQYAALKYNQKDWDVALRYSQEAKNMFFEINLKEEAENAEILHAGILEARGEKNEKE